MLRRPPDAALDKRNRSGAGGDIEYDLLRAPALMVNGVVVVNLARLSLPLRTDDCLSATALRTDAELSTRRPRFAIRGYAMQRLIGWQEGNLSRTAKVTLTHG